MCRSYFYINFSHPAAPTSNFNCARLFLNGALFAALLILHYGNAAKDSSWLPIGMPSPRHIKRVGINNGPFLIPLMRSAVLILQKEEVVFSEKGNES